MEGANQLRLIAADVIHKLWRAGELTQLELLAAQAKSSIADIKSKEDGETSP